MSDIRKSFEAEFGIDVIEPTRNGVWFESRHLANGKRRQRAKLTFITRTELKRLVAEVDELGEYHGDR